jgi:hypothetical protein
MAAAFPLPPSPPLEDIYAAADRVAAINHNIQALSHHEMILQRRMTRTCISSLPIHILLPTPPLNPQVILFSIQMYPQMRSN